MKKVQLGHSDLNISQISFGCMSLKKENTENLSLIKAAFDSGINFFDTADRYDNGWNEVILGKAVKEFRDDIYLSTKVGHQLSGDGSEWRWAPTKKHILSEVDQSLKRLQTDRIDLYQLHGGTLEDPIDEIIEAFEILQQQGKIRFYGISSIRPNVIRAYAEKSSISSVMMQYSLLDRRPEEECLNILQKKNIGVLARGTLAKGMLINKPAKDALDYSASEISELQKSLNKGGNALSRSVQFVLKHPAISSAVIGIRTEQQLQEILKAYKMEVKESKLESLKQMLPSKIYEQHR